MHYSFTFAMKTTRLTREQERETAFPYTLTADTGNKHASCPLALSTVYKSQEQQPVASLPTPSTDTIRPTAPQPPTPRCNLSPFSDPYPPSSSHACLSITVCNDRNGMHQHRFIYHSEVAMPTLMKGAQKEKNQRT